MSVGFIDIDIVGGKQDVQSMLEHLDSSLSDVGMQLFMNGRVAPFLRERAEQRFQGEGDDAVGKWAALSAPTQEWRESFGFAPSHPINKRTGQLEEYILNAPAQVTTRAGFALLVWPDAPPSDSLTAKKLRVAQQGWDSPTTPARAVLGLGETDLLHALTQLALHIQGWNTNIS